MNRIQLLNLISISREYNEIKDMIFQAIKLKEMLIQKSEVKSEKEEIQKSIDAMKSIFLKIQAETKQKLHRLKENLRK